MAHLICHICCHMAHHQLETIKREEEESRAKVRKQQDRAEKRSRDVTDVFKALGKNQEISTESQSKLDKTIQQLEIDNHDGLRLDYSDVQAIKMIIEKRYKGWSDFSSNIRGAMLPEITDMGERVGVFHTLDSSTQKSEKVARQLVGDPVHSMPFLFQQNLVTKDIAISALCKPSVTREERGVMWDKYFPDSVKMDKEIIEISVERAPVESCCCIVGDVPVWGKARSQRTEAEKKTQCVWEMWCIPRILCLPCNAVDDCLTIQDRSDWSPNHVTNRLIQ